MALNSTVSSLKDMLSQITQDLGKAEGGNKAAAQRVRTLTVKLEKVAKNYRKESIASEKNTKDKKPAKKTAAKKAAPAKKAGSASKGASSSKSASSSKAPAKKPAASKVKKPEAKVTAMARPRALSFKRPTAKLPTRKSR